MAGAATVSAQTAPSETHRPRVDPPRINFVYPTTETTVKSEDIQVIAQVIDDLGITRIRLHINGSAVPLVTAPRKFPSAVDIEMRVPLQVGPNHIVITATNKAGRTAHIDRLVYRTQASTANPERYAIVIGVGVYDNPQIPPLPSAEIDARAVHDFLTTKGGFAKDNVLLITDTSTVMPTLANMKRALGELFRETASDDTIFLYYAGHGAPDTTGTGDLVPTYLIPRDANPESLFVTAFAFEDIGTVVQRLRAAQVFVVLDACFTGWSGGGRAFTSQQQIPATTDLPRQRPSARQTPIEFPARPKGRVVITAHGRANECSPEPLDLKHGRFTHFLLEGMQGAADADNDKIVTIGELVDYVRRNVVEHAQRHNSRQSPLIFGSPDPAPFIELRP